MPPIHLWLIVEPEIGIIVLKSLLVGIFLGDLHFVTSQI